ncbi:MAG TPA: hypothetical protein VF765_20735 [Polyangiaceae bacterium]
MNSAGRISNSPRLKPPPLPKAHGLSVVPSRANVEDITDDADVTAVEDAPPELLAVARSDIRELRAPRPAPPRPVVKAIQPPPAPVPVMPPVMPPIAVTQPMAKPEPAPEVDALVGLKPRPVVLMRTVWLFTGFVASGAFRWTVAKLSRGKAWLSAEWDRAAKRAKAGG